MKRLKNIVVTDSKADMNTHHIVATDIKTGHQTDIYPSTKYQFDGKTLYIHLYIQYSSYGFNNKFNADGTLKLTEESIAVINGKARSDGTKYVELFQKGLMKYYNGQMIRGSSSDFGNKVNFKTALVIHRKDNRQEQYNENQRFIEVMIGGIDKHYTRTYFEDHTHPYWYHANEYVSGAGVWIYMPEDDQLKFNTEGYTTLTSDYMATSAHEMGHVLGLGDAYFYKPTRTDRCDENAETCSYENEEWVNMMKSEKAAKGFVANDFEMMLRAYKEIEKGKRVNQYYKTYDKENGKVSSDVIKNKEDKQKES